MHAVLLTVCCAVPMLLWPGCAPKKTVAVLVPAEDPEAEAKKRQRIADSALAAAAERKLSTASELLVASCDNYLALNPESPKYADVLVIKASLYYNKHLMEQARVVYAQILEKFPATGSAAEATRMIAQSYYEEKQFDSAQVWYRKLNDLPGHDINRGEAVLRIAESIFRRAEQFEAQKYFKEAAEQYKRISMEFPDSKIADVALFNASLCYEKTAEWSQAIIVLGQLLRRYSQSPLVPKAMFRIGKANEKLLKWEFAADSYLSMVAKFPTDTLAPSAMYNAGFCFENAEKLNEAAATFEKMVELYPESDDAADVLFRAGEIYGKLKNWDGVSRVSTTFTARFGNDADRVVQALCMAGIALYMQSKEDAAIKQFSGAIGTFAKIRNPSTANAYYAAKAQFTIGEIFHGQMEKIALVQPRSTYHRLVTRKSELLDKTVDSYSKTVKFNISEWTTRSIASMGQAYEDFALGIFKQERPSNLSTADQIALELGIAQAVEKYYIEKALHSYEQNVKLAIKENIEDKYVLNSRQKLTYLPFMAAENYLALTQMAREEESTKELSGFALIAKKLELLQKIAPFQESAANLFLKCLEVGSTYQQIDTWYQKASASITSLSYGTAITYADVVSIVIEAPIPSAFDRYEKFVYKTKLLKQVEGYEKQAVNNFLKTLKIGTAYSIEDESVKKAREGLANLLFISGRCKDLLCVDLFANPPFPRKISAAEQDEYRARFEEIGLRYQEQAFEVYKSVLRFAVQNYAAGPGVTYAYVRLFQDSPEQYGVPEEQLYDTTLASGPRWLCTTDSLPDWFSFEFPDSGWTPAQEGKASGEAISGFPGKPPVPMQASATSARAFFRLPFMLADQPRNATLYLAGTGETTVFVNGQRLAADSGTAIGRVTMWDMSRKLRRGRNVLAMEVTAATPPAVMYPLIEMRLGRQIFVPRPPLAEKNLPIAQVRRDVYEFPFIKNFTPEPGETSP